MRFDIHREVGNEDLLCLLPLRGAVQLLSTFGCNLPRAFSTLNTKAAISSGTVVSVNRTDWQYVPNTFVHSFVQGVPLAT